MGQTECHTGWKLFQGYCYGLAKERLSWSEAQNICSAYGGSLAEIHSQAEHDFVKSMLINASISNEADGVWIGGSDIFMEGSWEWVGSKIPILEYTNWGQNEPNSIVGYNREDCLCMWKDLGWAWNDESCVTNNVLYFMCQTRLVAYGRQLD
ncbi:C-type lectin [Elysia marginata]|uniref:C-type lectin n=1 Tax=Elysia marginata TaxID=1093978 RepID=A0AAV4IV60_9GAST|nr:C-type lectin [Elysia marginata]